MTCAVVDGHPCSGVYVYLVMRWSFHGKDREFVARKIQLMVLKMQMPNISTLPLLVDVITAYRGLCGIAIFLFQSGLREILHSLLSYVG